MLDENFWNNKYLNNEAAWDIGYISTPIKEYIDQLKNKGLKIIIPGCGNAYEAEYLFKNGFSNVFLIDFSPTALKQFSERVPQFPKEQLICDNFFNHTEKYDLMFEQTFFCALDSSLRKIYANKMYQLLKPEGKLVGLLFNIPLNSDKPPFGGNEIEYRKLFSENFKISMMQVAYNSIPQRTGNELFFKLATTMLLFYLFFGFFPAAGPQFYFSSPEKDLPTAFIFDKIMHFIQQAEQPTGAFPSSHVGISVAVLVLLRTKAPLFFKIAVPFVILLICSTVYIKAHYVVDVIGGLLAVPIVLSIASYLYKKTPHFNL